MLKNNVNTKKLQNKIYILVELVNDQITFFPLKALSCNRKKNEDPILS